MPFPFILRHFNLVLLSILVVLGFSLGDELECSSTSECTIELVRLYGEQYELLKKIQSEIPNFARKSVVDSQTSQLSQQIGLLQPTVSGLVEDVEILIERSTATEYHLETTIEMLKSPYLLEWKSIIELPNWVPSEENPPQYAIDSSGVIHFRGHLTNPSFENQNDFHVFQLTEYNDCPDSQHSSVASWEDSVNGKFFPVMGRLKFGLFDIFPSFFRIGESGPISISLDGLSFSYKTESLSAGLEFSSIGSFYWSPNTVEITKTLFSGIVVMYGGYPIYSISPLEDGAVLYDLSETYRPKYDLFLPTIGQYISCCLHCGFTFSIGANGEVKAYRGASDIAVGGHWISWELSYLSQISYSTLKFSNIDITEQWEAYSNETAPAQYAMDENLTLHLTGTLKWVGGEFQFPAIVGKLPLLFAPIYDSIFKTVGNSTVGGMFIAHVKVDRHGYLEYLDSEGGPPDQFLSLDGIKFHIK